jgi:hypothetical protein
MPPSGIGRCSRRSTKEPRPVSETVLHQLPFVRLKQRSEIGRHLRKRIRLYLLKPQFRDDVCYRAGEAGAAGEFGISAKPASLGQSMNRAVCDGLNTERPKRDGALRGQHRSCQRRGQLRQPKDARFSWARLRASSLAAPRVAPIISISSAGARALSQSRQRAMR